MTKRILHGFVDQPMPYFMILADNLPLTILNLQMFKIKSSCCVVISRKLAYHRIPTQRTFNYKEAWKNSFSFAYFQNLPQMTNGRQQVLNCLLSYIDMLFVRCSKTYRYNTIPYLSLLSLFIDVCLLFYFRFSFSLHVSF